MAYWRENEALDETRDPLIQSSEPRIEDGNGETEHQSAESIWVKAWNQAAKGAHDLTKHLPIGSSAALQALAPITTAHGHCKTFHTRLETTILLSICVLLCVILALTDSFIDNNGKLHYGIATFKGIFVFDGAEPSKDPKEYRICLQDFVHAVTSIALFADLALCNNKVFNCFYKSITDEYTLQMMGCAQLTVAVIGCAIFLFYPSNRQGIGFPRLAA